MFRLTRISATPASPLKIKIAKPDGVDAGLTAGGSYVLEPGDSVQVDEYVAGVIMNDPGLAVHFECLPPWKPAGVAPEPAPEPAPVAPDAEPVPAVAKRRIYRTPTGEKPGE